jgi:hypothetical protein
MDLVDPSAVVQHSFSQRGFARVDVIGDADIS